MGVCVTKTVSSISTISMQEGEKVIMVTELVEVVIDLYNTGRSIMKKEKKESKKEDLDHVCACNNSARFYETAVASDAKDVG